MNCSSEECFSHHRGSSTEAAPPKQHHRGSTTDAAAPMQHHRSSTIEAAPPMQHHRGSTTDAAPPRQHHRGYVRRRQLVIRTPGCWKPVLWECVFCLRVTSKDKDDTNMVAKTWESCRNVARRSIPLYRKPGFALPGSTTSPWARSRSRKMLRIFISTLNYKLGFRVWGLGFGVWGLGFRV